MYLILGNVAFENILLQCECDSNCQPGAVEWRHSADGTNIQHGIIIDTTRPRYSMQGERGLTIHDAVSVDAGVYSCYFPSQPNIIVDAMCVLVFGKSYSCMENGSLYYCFVALLIMSVVETEKSIILYSKALDFLDINNKYGYYTPEAEKHVNIHMHLLIVKID